MRHSRLAAAVLLLVLPSLRVAAQTGDDLKTCESRLNENKQPAFSEAVLGKLDAVGVVPGTPPALRLKTNTEPLNPEKGIYFPFDQDVTISYVYRNAGASHSLGWMYYDELVAAGYINQGALAGDSTDDTLVDGDGNGVADLHDDIYNTSNTRPYIGSTRRCLQTFSHGSGSSRRTYYEPDLAKGAPCGTTWDATLNRVGGSYANGSSGWSDGGLHARIPNLLEPKDPANGNLGLGRLLYLLADDDSDRTTYGSLPPVADAIESSDGIPDYDVSAYDSSGRLLSVNANPNPGISAYDRTISMGTVKGGREIVFFFIAYYAGGDTCLRPSGTTCAISLRTPISVFWSKSFLNMDLGTSLPNPVTSVDIGCDGNTTCSQSGSSLVGWLDVATIARLNTPAYGNFVLPHERVDVRRPLTTTKAPHVIVGAPTTDPLRWVLGWEDLNGAGDRDFNDVVFIINKKNNGGVQSGVVSGDISPTLAEDFTITNVRFKRDDDVTDGSFYAVPPRTDACNKTPKPDIRYQLAVDCNICRTVLGVTTCTEKNPSPTWMPVVFPATTPPTQEVVVDMAKLGFSGSQLCWRATIESPDEFCQPTINKIEVGYQAIRAGNYSRAAVSPLGNAVVYGGYEVVGRKSAPAPSVRTYDGRKDLSLRGHLYLKTLYEPEDPSKSLVTERWDSGLTLSNASFDARKVYTMGSPGQRLSLADDVAMGDNSLLFPTNAGENFCKNEYVDVDGPVNDLNRDRQCTAADRTFLQQWLQGWEDKSRVSPALPRRSWPMGQINLSTAAVISAPGNPTWLDRVKDYSEKDAFRINFKNKLADRRTVAYVGTSSGLLHGFFAGEFRQGDNPCTGKKEHQGHFKKSGNCGATDYGDGSESFAYLPRSQLSLFVNNYTQRTKVAGGQKPRVDASPSVADIDLGGLTNASAWTPSSASPDKGAKTVLVSSTGAGTSTVFSLDITNPNASVYPVPMWEFDIAKTRIANQTVADWFKNSAIPADVQGSRHSPPVVRIQVDSDTDTGKAPVANKKKIWAAVVASDYKPSTGAAGTVYLLDMATGLPLQIGLSTTGPTGIVTLGRTLNDLNEGVGGEPAVVDYDEDGLYDVIYVPSTSGKVYRINLNDLNNTREVGRKLSSCVVANGPADVLADVGSTQARLQRIHSNLAVRVTKNAEEKKVVQIFFGTADNPDDPYDTAATSYHVFGYEDLDPFSTPAADGTCLGKQIRETKLDAGQVVWGGVVLGKEQIYAATAVGSAADACNLSQDTSGKLYSMAPSGATAPSGQVLGGHGINTPVIFDQHLFVITAAGKVQAKGGAWNNDSGKTGLQRSRVLMWQAMPNSTLPQ